MTLKQECISYANGRYKVEFNWSIFAEYCGLNQTLLPFYRSLITSHCIYNIEMNLYIKNRKY